MKKINFTKVLLVGVAVCLTSTEVFSQVAGLWQANGSGTVYTLRNTGIKTNNPTAALDVNGRSKFRGNSSYDSSLTALSVQAQSATFATAVVTGQFMAASLIVNGNATISGVLSAGTITSPTGTISFSSNNLSTTGNVSANTVNASTFLVNGNPLPTSQWTTNPIDGSIFFNGNVFVKTLNASDAISIGNFRFSNGGAAPPPPAGIKDSIQTPNPMVLASAAQTIVMIADTVQMGNFVAATPGAAGTGQLSVLGNITASNNLRVSSLAGTGNKLAFIDSLGNVRTSLPAALCGTTMSLPPCGWQYFTSTTNFLFLTPGAPANSPLLSMTAAGHVGIGPVTPTTDPGVLLDVNNGINNGFGRFGNNAGHTDIGFNGAHGIIDANQDLLINFYSGKNVGIGGGPNGPADLSVSGNVKINPLSGTGTRAVVADQNGLLSTQAIAGAQVLSINQSTISLSGGGGSVTVPSSADNLGNHTATTTLNMNVHDISNIASSISWAAGGPVIQKFGQDLFISNFAKFGIGGVPSVTLDVVGSGKFTGNLQVNGSAVFNNIVTISGATAVGSLTIGGSSVTLGTAVAGQTWISSDARYKKNIEELESPLEKVLKIKGVRYDYDREKFPYFKEGKTMGFVAQDLKEVFPEAVMLKDDGYYAVNYNAIIPVLVEAVKEQQKMLEAKSDENNSIKDELSSIKNQLAEHDAYLQECCNAKQTTTGSIHNIPDGATAYLEQNIPNPFTQNTTINYFVPVQTNNASVIICDLQGKQITKFDALQKGKGSVKINGGELYAGIFIYILIADGKEIDSKKMILTK